MIHSILGGGGKKSPRIVLFKQLKLFDGREFKGPLLNFIFFFKPSEISLLHLCLNQYLAFSL